MRKLILTAGALAAFVAPVLVPPPGTPGGLTAGEIVVACRASGLAGGALVERARRLTAAQFVTYSCEAPWESPARALRGRRGYSSQYNAVLADVLRDLGFPCRLVYAARVRLATPAPWWRTGHAWVRVLVDGREQDVCARHGDDRGVAFTPVTDVFDFGLRTRVNTTVALSVVVAAARWRALLTGRPLPGWLRSPF